METPVAWESLKGSNRDALSLDMRHSWYTWNCLPPFWGNSEASSFHCLHQFGGSVVRLESLAVQLELAGDLQRWLRFITSWPSMREVILNNLRGPVSIRWKALRAGLGFPEEKKFHLWIELQPTLEKEFVLWILDIYCHAPQLHKQILSINPFILCNKSLTSSVSLADFWPIGRKIPAFTVRIS
jgi:hypothetical protein